MELLMPVILYLAWMHILILAITVSVVREEYAVSAFVWSAILLGALLNVGVQLCNGGKMPVLGQYRDSAYHVRMTSRSRLKYLADVIPWLRGMVSVGDLLQSASMVAAAAYLLYVLFSALVR
jgi:hypothetical protein